MGKEGFCVFFIYYLYFYYVYVFFFFLLFTFFFYCPTSGLESDTMIACLIHYSTLLCCNVLDLVTVGLSDTASGQCLTGLRHRQPGGHYLASGCHGNHWHVPMGYRGSPLPLLNPSEPRSLLDAASEGLIGWERQTQPSQPLRQELSCK